MGQRGFFSLCLLNCQPQSTMLFAWGCGTVTHPQLPGSVLVSSCSTLPQGLGCLDALDQVGVLCKGAAPELPRPVQAQQVDRSAAGGPAEEDDGHDGDNGPAAHEFVSEQAATFSMIQFMPLSAWQTAVLLLSALPLYGKRIQPHFASNCVVDIPQGRVLGIGLVVRRLFGSAAVPLHNTATFRTAEVQERVWDWPIQHLLLQEVLSNEPCTCLWRSLIQWRVLSSTASVATQVLKPTREKMPISATMKSALPVCRSLSRPAAEQVATTTLVWGLPVCAGAAKGGV